MICENSEELLAQDNLCWTMAPLDHYLQRNLAL